MGSFIRYLVTKPNNGDNSKNTWCNFVILDNCIDVEVCQTFIQKPVNTS